MTTKRAVKGLQDGLEEFKKEALKKGWEEDEVKEKITEVFQNFHWYEFNPVKKSWKSRLFKIALYIFIIYLAVTAVLERNRRWKKHVDDFFFDNQFAYHTQRSLRFMSLPFYKLYDFSSFHSSECLIANPFLPTVENIDCVFCEGVKDVKKLSLNDNEVYDTLRDGSPYVLTDAEGYSDNDNGFTNLQKMILENADGIDDASCKKRLVDPSTKISEFFKMSEDELIKGNKSIAWRNCDTYGTRFYRTLYPRLSFIPKESEVYLEKEMFLTQKGVNMSMPPMDGETALVAQIKGESFFSMKVPESCHGNCTTELTVSLKQGEILAVSQNLGWLVSFKSVSDGTSILYISSFT